MEASSEAVKDLLKALTVKIRNSRADLDAQAIGNAFLGIQNMTGEAVQRVVEALEKKELKAGVIDHIFK